MSGEEFGAIVARALIQHFGPNAGEAQINQQLVVVDLIFTEVLAQQKEGLAPHLAQTWVRAARKAAEQRISQFKLAAQHALQTKQ